MDSTSDHKRPFYHYIGLVLIVVLAIGGINTSRLNDKKREMYSAQPKVGDVYTIRVADYYKIDEEEDKNSDKLDYTIIKITEIKDGEAIFVLADATYGSPSDAETYFERNEVKYVDYGLAIKLENLPKLNKEGKIKDIFRK